LTIVGVRVNYNTKRKQTSLKGKFTALFNHYCLIVIPINRNR